MDIVKKYRLELDAEKHPALCVEEEYKYSNRITNPKTAVKLCNAVYRLQYAAEEHLVMIAINTWGKVLGTFEVSHGTVMQSICSAREIYLRALLVGASGVILIHNHPSGNPEFSRDDMLCYRKINDAGKLIGIGLQDFIVMGENESYSSKMEMLEEDTE